MSPILCLCVSRSMYYYYYMHHPGKQPNSTWVSEDGNVVISIAENPGWRIYIQTGDANIECLFKMGPGQLADVYDIDAQERVGLYEEEHFERWTCAMKDDDTFVVTVKKTTFFTEGEKITFHKQQ